MSLVETLWFSHSALDVEGTYVLPVLLQQRHQEVDGQVDVGHQVLLVHLHVSDGNGQAQNLRTVTGEKQILSVISYCPFRSLGATRIPHH